jgi:perosamine synthetase
MVRKITLGTLNISETGKRYVNDILSTNRLSRGPYTEKFEKDFAALHGCKYGIFMNSGTSALQVALAALKEVHGYKDGDEVIVPACTFIATSNVILQNNLTPVFVDVDPSTFNIDVEKVERAITSRTRAIIPVHLFGLPADMKWLMKVAQQYELQVIEDSCETMFASTEGKSVGSFGDLACFSTYVAHLIVGGVGGLVTTNDSNLNEICKSLMQHGRDSVYSSIDDDDIPSGLANIIERRYKFDRVGYSYRATELEAAIALSELERWEENIGRRRFAAAHLKSLLSDLPDILQLPFTPDGCSHSYMMFPMVLNEAFDRDKFLLFLENNGIETRYLFPLLGQPVYRKLFPGEAEKYPVAQKLAKHGLFVGLHQGLTTEDIVYVSDIIHRYFSHRYYA